METETLSSSPSQKGKIPFVRLSLIRESEVDYRERVTDPQSAIRIIGEMTKNDATERMFVVAFDVKNRINHIYPAAHGGSDSVACRSADLFRCALLANAHGIMLLHNHPSDDPTPSQEDRNMTDLVEAGCKVLGLRFLDHIVVAGNEFFSIKLNQKGSVKA